MKEKLSIQNIAQGHEKFVLPRMLPLIVLLLVLISTISIYTYFSINIGKLEDRGRGVAKQLVYILRVELSSKPYLWKYNTAKIVEFAKSYLIEDRDLWAVVVTTANDEIIMEQPVRRREKHNPVIYLSENLDLGEERHATVWVGMSLARVKREALSILLPLFFAGFSMALGLYFYVKKIVRDSNLKIKSLLEEIEEARQELIRVNRNLEERVEERTSKLQEALLELENSRNEIAKLAAKTQVLNEEEKRQIARELHDAVGQALVALRLNLDLMERSESSEEKEKIKMDTLNLIENAIEETRRVVSNLRPPAIDSLGFEESVIRLVEGFASKSGIESDVSINLHGGKLSNAVEIALYRVVQEAMTNVVRHSHAKKVVVCLSVIDSNAVLEIVDDGIGFDFKLKDGFGGCGLKGMKERIEILGGTFMIETKLGKGTKILVKIPYV